MHCRKILNCLSHWETHIHIYVYIHMCVCVCACISCVLEKCVTDGYGMYESMKKLTDHPNTL